MPVDERVARSVALEQAYVHDVYEQFCDSHVGKPWPKVQQFLEDLEPGSVICDVGEFNFELVESKCMFLNVQRSRLSLYKELWGTQWCAL